jgi:hypothetical protein
VERGFKATESKISAEDMETLIVLLQQLGFPEKTPRVRNSSDPVSSWWAHLSFEVEINGQSGRLELGLGPDGVTGQDAESLRSVFQMLLELAGVQDQWTWKLLTGQHSRL